jgi:hypothetical protein
MDQRPKTLKLLQENIGKAFDNIGANNNFLNKTPIAQEIRAIIKNWD